MVNSVTAIRDSWSAIQATGQVGVGKIQHDVREMTHYPNGPSVERIRHYEVLIYDRNAQLSVPNVKGTSVDINI